MKEKNLSSLRRILPLLRPYRLLAAATLLCSLVYVAGQLLIPILSGQAIDHMLGRGRVELAPVLRAGALIACTAALSALCQHLLALCNNKITSYVCRDLRNRLNDKFHRLPLSYLDAHPIGDLVSRMVTDVDTFADGLLMGFTQLFTGVLTILSVLSIMLYLNPLIALAVVVLTPLSIFVARFITTRTHRFFKEQSVIRGEQTALINELIGGQRVVKAFGHEEESLTEFDEINGRLEKASMQATFFSSLTNPSTRLVNNLVYAVVTLISALSALGGYISIGQLSIFLSYASQYAKPFNEISGVVTELQNALTCLERIFALLEEPDQVPEAAVPLAPEARGQVELSHIYFSYVPERPLIEDFSLFTAPGKRIAIVGPTGCGKTTLINLLMRFYDVDRGVIRVDGADIRQMTRHDLRSRYGMVLQDTWLCTGTVRENIAYGHPDASQEEIIAAAKAAHAHGFIQRLPQGYDTLLTENGAGLSVGEKQLLCIARAMVTRPTMLILDEATSSIDTRTELKIQSAFAHMMAGRTSFIVAHRLSTIREADQILVMKDGKIIEQGNHESLLAQNGFYAALYNSQFAAS